MKTLLAALLALAVPALAEDWNARVTEAAGTVLIHVDGAEDGLPAEEGTPLEAGDRIETGADGRAELALEAESLMELGPGSSFTVGSTKEADSWFSLSLGSLMAKVKSLADTRRKRFQIRTPTSVCAVRGTEFGVEVGDDGETSVGVFDEGQVAVSAGGDGTGAETLLGAKQETTVAPGDRDVKVRRLERLERRRERMSHLRARREVLKRSWKNIPPERRREMRQKWRQNMGEKLKNMPPGRREKVREMKEKRKDRAEERRGGKRREQRDRGRRH